MSTPVKMGIVVTQPTAFVERNPDFVAHVRRNMERDIRDSGRLIDSESWKQEEVNPAGGFAKPMTQFSLDAVSQAHVIQFVDYSNGIYHVTARPTEVQIGTLEAAKARAEALNAEHGHTDYDAEYDEWSGDHYAVKTVPLGYPEPDIKVTNRFPAQRLADSQRAIRMSTERMRG